MFMTSWNMSTNCFGFVSWSVSAVNVSLVCHFLDVISDFFMGRQFGNFLSLLIVRSKERSEIMMTGRDVR